MSEARERTITPYDAPTLATWAQSTRQAVRDALEADVPVSRRALLAEVERLREAQEFALSLAAQSCHNGCAPDDDCGRCDPCRARSALSGRPPQPTEEPAR